MEYVLLIIGLVVNIALLGGFITYTVKFCRRKQLGGIQIKVIGKDKLVFMLAPLLIGASLILVNYGFVVKDGFDLSVTENNLMVLGSLFAGMGFSLLFSSFAIYYYRKDIEPTQRKVSRIVLFASIVLFILGVWMFTDGFANHLTYPLVNGINIPGGFTTPNHNITGFTVKWYGVIIVCGAGVSYFVSDHYFFKKYQKHGILDTLLLVAFPAGIIGARLWYCIVLEPGTNIFNFQNGGLAIQGGALLGIIAGVTFMLIFRRYVNIRYAMDIIVPTILLAQAIGRFGNFFNQEVYGALAYSNENLWFLLPKVIYNNMIITSNGVTAFRLPLFLIESFTNFAGYFIIRYAIGKPLKKYLSLGDLSMCYVIWYGLTRIVLEPLREGFSWNSDHVNGFGYNQSYITAIVMLCVGILGIVGFHLYDYIRKRKGLPPKNLETI